MWCRGRVPAAPASHTAAQIVLKMAFVTRCCVVLMVLTAPTARCWDTEEMELFDVVEEVNQNFYEVLGISQVRFRVDICV